MRKYKREFAGVEAFSRFVSRVNQSGKFSAVYVVTKDELPEYVTSAALTHKEAVKFAVTFWKKKGLIQ